MAIDSASIAAQHYDIAGVHSPLAPRVTEIVPVPPPETFDKLTENAYYIIEQPARYEGEVRIVRDWSDPIFAQIPICNMYVTVNLDGVLTWKRVYFIREVLDIRTGRPYDPFFGFTQNAPPVESNTAQDP